MEDVANILMDLQKGPECLVVALVVVTTPVTV